MNYYYYYYYSYFYYWIIGVPFIFWILKYQINDLKTFYSILAFSFCWLFLHCAEDLLLNLPFSLHNHHLWISMRTIVLQPWPWKYHLGLISFHIKTFVDELPSRKKFHSLTGFSPTQLIFCIQKCEWELPIPSY